MRERAMHEFRCEVADALARGESQEDMIAALVFERAGWVLSREVCRTVAGDVLVLQSLRRELIAEAAAGQQGPRPR
jgi:hypothetical protein